MTSSPPAALPPSALAAMDTADFEALIASALGFLR
jgi:hypothetical protein